MFIMALELVVLNYLDRLTNVFAVLNLIKHICILYIDIFSAFKKEKKELLRNHDLYNLKPAICC